MCRQRNTRIRTKFEADLRDAGCFLEIGKFAPVPCERIERCCVNRWRNLTVKVKNKVTSMILVLNKIHRSNNGK